MMDQPSSARQGVAQNQETAGTGTLLALGVEPGWTRACLLENISGQYRLAGWLSM